MKSKIEELYIKGINEDVAPNVFAQQVLDLFNVRLRYLNIYECDCGWSGNISQLYYRVEHMGINAMLECPSCYTELIRLY